jgi:hypothetical protein
LSNRADASIAGAAFRTRKARLGAPICP